MIERGSLWLPLAILLVLAGLSFWIERTVQMPVNGNGAELSDPEGIMENFSALRTDPQGQPQYRLSARRLKHYSNSKLTELDAPRFTQLDATQGEVVAQARQATVSADGKEVELVGNVNVERQARPGQSALSLTTSRLLVFPDQHLLRAPGSVQIQDATLSVTAGAMEYRTDRRTIKLTGRVKARYLAKAR
jgi:lipopolysaccharide export system protein LptC